MGVLENIAAASKTFRECFLTVGVHGHCVTYCKYRIVCRSSEISAATVHRGGGT